MRIVFLGGYAHQMTPASASRFEQHLDVQRHSDGVCVDWRVLHEREKVALLENRPLDCMHWITPTEKDTFTETLEKRLWDSAGQFHTNSGLQAQEYSGPIRGLIFLRFAESDDLSRHGFYSPRSR